MTQSEIDYKHIDLRDLASLVSNKLKEHGIDAVLVGGACVTIYSHNRYMSYDLDYVTFHADSKIRVALKELGFIEHGKYFKRNDCKFFIDFVTPPVAIGNEPIREFEHISTDYGTIKLLTPTDCVKDRLASFYHWNDKQSFEQALNVCEDQKVDIKEIKRWSKQGMFGTIQSISQRI